MTLLLAWLGTYGYCVASGFLPFLPAEVYLLGASAMSPPAFVAPLILAATLGQMTAKTAMFSAGRGLVKVKGARFQKWLADAEQWARNRKNIGAALIFISASGGLPPFYIVCVAAGMLRVGWVPFLVFGSLGRAVRFAVVVAFPQLVK
jgi:membrane protein YqaA with SNARE-associated domain